jgi:hypothetical protein
MDIERHVVAIESDQLSNSLLIRWAATCCPIVQQAAAQLKSTSTHLRATTMIDANGAPDPNLSAELPNRADGFLLFGQLIWILGSYNFWAGGLSAASAICIAWSVALKRD